MCPHHLFCLFFAVFGMLACSSTPSKLDEDGFSFEIAALEESDTELISTWRRDIGHGLNLVEKPTGQWRFRVTLDPNSTDISDQGARIAIDDTGIHSITARTLNGASNGLYFTLQRYGVIYAHPEETLLPPTSPNYKQKKMESTVIEPDFAWRGFHEHTQHPIPMSIFALEASDENLGYAKAYIRWLARNRQNVFTFHFLNTVEQETWIPHMEAIVEYAHLFGVRVGMVVGFVDQQQNAFRLIRPSENSETDQDQIIRRLTPLLDTGLDWIGFQIGSSEFTKPEDGQVLRWLEETLVFLSQAYPLVKPFAWIHITCGLESDEGGSFFHLPLRADSRLTSFVHTTMFYSLEDPAPVYDCEDFSHQVEYFQQANGGRELIYFPETAWWLGFDNNVPFVTPIVGPSRQRDIELISANFDVSGHITFSTGREWTYWMYDHYLTRATWDAELSWSDYISELKDVYGTRADQVQVVIEEWTQRQLEDFYERKPEIYFYLSGELPQDEIGARVGVIARRPKPAFREILALPEPEFDVWQREDLSLLEEMSTFYQGIIEQLPMPEESDTSLYKEFYHSYAVSALRVQHAFKLYSAVKSLRAMDESAARAFTEEAKATTNAARQLIDAQAQYYRYSANVLTDRRPSLTTYPFGYLHETSTGYFWHRRDQQLESLLNETLDPPVETWADTAGDRYATVNESLRVSFPPNPLLTNLLTGLMPRLLARLDLAQSAAWLGVDRNENFLPDAFSLTQIEEIEVIEDHVDGSIESLGIDVIDEAGSNLGTLYILNTQLEFTLGSDPSVSIKGVVDPDNLAAIVSGFGIEVDAAKELIKTVWGLERNAPLLERLDIELSIPLAPIDSPE